MQITSKLKISEKELSKPHKKIPFFFIIKSSMPYIAVGANKIVCGWVG